MSEVPRLVDVERPRAFRRQGLLGRLAPFASAGLISIALTPIFLDVTRPRALALAAIIDVVMLTLAVVVPWPRLPRWTESIIPISSFVIIGLLLVATGGSGSILSALMMLPVFWLALHGSRREMHVVLVLLALALVMPIVIAGPPTYPSSEFVRAVMWTMVAATIGFAIQRMVETTYIAAREAETTLAARAKANEQLRMTSELKDGFVAMVSHELRTPLTSIRGFANTIRHRYDDLDPEEHRRFAGIIEDQAERLSRLVEDLLVLSRIESGGFRGDVRPIEVQAIVERALHQLDLDVDVVVRGGTKLRAMADADQVEQMVCNYVSNARRHGSGPIEVDIARVGEFVHIIVSDAGTGVPADFVPLLFERFTQAMDTPMSGGGTGLGLSIVRGLARERGGEAWYEHRPGGGASFFVSLPIASIDPVHDAATRDDTDPELLGAT